MASDLLLRFPPGWKVPENLLTTEDFALALKARPAIIERAFADAEARLLNGKSQQTRPKHVPRHDQTIFTGPDLVYLWNPFPRSSIYKILAKLPTSALVGPSEYLHPKIDTTKRFKRGYRTFRITRATKEALERKLNLPLGGRN